MANDKPQQEAAYLCVTCGTQYAASPEPPAACAICCDSRQFVGLDGQKWTTLQELRAKHTNEFVLEEPGIHSIHTEPAFAIGERAFLIQTPRMNILWDCISLINERTILKVRELGGVDAIAISHPHYYTTMVEWSVAFGNVPIYIHEADRKWVQRPHPNVRFWAGETWKLGDGLMLIHTPGHFDGYQVLLWEGGAAAEGALFCGDQPQVCMNINWLSFMYSYPNYIPLGPQTVNKIVCTLEPLKCDRMYGAFPKRTVWHNAKEILRASAERYLRAISDEGAAEAATANPT